MQIHDTDHLIISPCRTSCEEVKMPWAVVPLDDENLLPVPPSSASTGIASYPTSSLSAALAHTTAADLPSVASSATREASPTHLPWRLQIMSPPGAAHGSWIHDTDHLIGSGGQPKGSLELPRRFTQWTAFSRTVEVSLCGVTTRLESLASSLSCNSWTV